MWSPARGNRPIRRTIIGNVAPVSNTAQSGRVQNSDAQHSPSIVAISAGRTSTIRRGTREVTTAFVKSPLSGPVDVGVLGIGGDEHVYEHHGGPDMALLAYPFEHYDHWRACGLDLPPVAAMAENLTTTGLVETEVAIGDVFTIGTATVQVTQPRSPCHKLAARFGRRSLPVEMQTTGYTGFLLRVLEPGQITAGDAVVAGGNTADDVVTIAEAGRILNVDRHDVEGARRLLAIAELGSATRRTLTARVDAGGQHGEDADRLYSDLV